MQNDAERYEMITTGKDRSKDLKSQKIFQMSSLPLKLYSLRDKSLAKNYVNWMSKCFKS